MPRYALKIEYNGAPFYGWQRQNDFPSVQQCLEEALLKVDPQNSGVTAAGRTDKGVHASGQVVHTDMVRDWEAFRLAEALNYHLKPNPVAVVNAAPVPDDFHARFWAIERQYLYRLISRRAPMTFDAGSVWRVPYVLDRAAMQEGANHLLGLHDFTTFRSTVCQAKSPIRTVDELTVEEIPLADATEFRFHVRARAFLHNQVRSFVGTLERVGGESWTPEDVKIALEAKDRTACGPVCPPQGLYLTEVTYPVDPFAGRRSGTLLEIKDIPS
jgi:tRNA pseudouridine38-40 synthase